MNADPVVRSFQPGERDALLEMKCAIWPHVVLENERRRWDWQFDENPSYDPEHPTALVLEVGGKLAGFFTLIPHRVHLGDALGLACDGVDFCVDDAYRGQGLSKLLVERWMDPATCDFSFTTTPSSVAIHVMTGCGGQLLGSTNETVAHAWFVDGAHDAPPDVPLDDVKEVEAYGDDWDQLWERIRKHHPLCLVRDALYLNWRHRDFPFQKSVLLESRDASGALTGAAVVQVDRESDRLYLCELLTEPTAPHAWRGLVRRAVGIAPSSGQQLLALAPRSVREAGWAGDEGFEPLPGDVPKFLGKVNPPSASVAVTDWFVTLGDGDQLYNVGEPKEDNRG